MKKKEESRYGDIENIKDGDKIFLDADNGTVEIR